MLSFKQTLFLHLSCFEFLQAYKITTDVSCGYWVSNKLYISFPLLFFLSSHQILLSSKLGKTKSTLLSFPSSCMENEGQAQDSNLGIKNFSNNVRGKTGLAAHFPLYQNLSINIPISQQVFTLCQHNQVQRMTDMVSKSGGYHEK